MMNLKGMVLSLYAEGTTPTEADLTSVCEEYLQRQTHLRIQRACRTIVEISKSTLSLSDSIDVGEPEAYEDAITELKEIVGNLDCERYVMDANKPTESEPIIDEVDQFLREMFSGMGIYESVDLIAKLLAEEGYSLEMSTSKGLVYPEPQNEPTSGKQMIQIPKNTIVAKFLYNGIPDKGIDKKLDGELTEWLEEQGFHFVGSGYDIPNDVRDLLFETENLGLTSEPTETPLESFLEGLKVELHQNSDYAQGWIDNISVQCQDAGCDKSIADEGAKRFMKLLFDVDIPQDEMAVEAK